MELLTPVRYKVYRFWEGGRDEESFLITEAEQKVPKYLSLQLKERNKKGMVE